MPGKVFTAGEILTAADTNEFLVNNGYQFRETVYFTSSGTFDKGDYPWLRAIRVKCVGGGGGGGGAATNGATAISIAGSGGGAAYSESFITDITGLASSVTVTRGAGGTGGAAGANNGSDGGQSSFGALVSADGGGGGVGSLTFGAPGINGGASGQSVGVGDFVIAGSGATVSIGVNASTVGQGNGGSSHFGGGLRGINAFATGFDGSSTSSIGAGATGGINAQNIATARAGGTGGNGIVVVELYG
jgi:hypothetical protein